MVHAKNKVKCPKDVFNTVSFIFSLAEFSRIYDITSLSLLLFLKMF